MKFEEKLVKLRKARNITQEQLAEKLGVSRQAVSRWEAGESTPDMLNLAGLCKYFGVSSDYLINDDFTSDEDIPVVQQKNEELNTVKAKKKSGHLISAICFTIAALCNVIVIATTTSAATIGSSCFGAAATAALAVVQMSLYLKK